MAVAIATTVASLLPKVIKWLRIVKPAQKVSDILAQFPQIEKKFGKTKAFKIGNVILRFGKRLGFGAGGIDPATLKAQIEKALKTALSKGKAKVLANPRVKKAVTTGRKVQKVIGAGEEKTGVQTGVITAISRGAKIKGGDGGARMIKVGGGRRSANRSMIKV